MRVRALVPCGALQTYQLANRFVRVVLDSRGRLVSLVDRAQQRELVPQAADPAAAGQGVGNRLRCGLPLAPALLSLGP